MDMDMCKLHVLFDQRRETGVERRKTKDGVISEMEIKEIESCDEG